MSHLLLSMLALVAGVLLYSRLAQERRLHALQSERWFGRLTGQGLFDGLVDGLFSLAGRITTALEIGSLQRYIAWMLTTCVLLAAAPDLADVQDKKGRLAADLAPG